VDQSTAVLIADDLIIDDLTPRLAMPQRSGICICWSEQTTGIIC
jgi:hypothetical protein